MSYFILSPLINCIASLLLGATVVLKNRKDEVTSSFFQYCLIISLWCGFYFLWQISRTSDDALVWSRALMAAASFLPVFYLKFVSNLIKQPLPVWVEWVLYVIFAGFAIACFTPGFIPSVEPKAGFAFWPTAGMYFGPYLIFWACFVFYAIIILFIAYLRASNSKTKAQLRLVLLGNLFGYLGGATNFPLWFNIPILPWGNILVTAIQLTAAYGIAAYGLFDIRIFIRRTVIFTGLLAFTVVIYTFIIVIFAQVFQENGPTNEGFVANLISALIIGFSFDPLRRWLQDHTDKFLYKKEYQQQTVLKELSTSLNNVIGLDEALEIVMHTIVKAFRVSHAITYVFQPADSGGLAIKRIQQVGYSVTRNLMLQDKDFIIDYFSRNPKIITTDELSDEIVEEEKTIKHAHSGNKKNQKEEDLGKLVREHATKQVVLRKLRSLEVDMIVPLHLGQQFIGLIFLSGKLSGESFNDSDHQLLELSGGVAISSIQKAKLYEGDQMKSEFVSIASHELLTPISAIEGYLSMILDEGIGKVDPQAKEYLGKVYLSSKRLSQLVKDLLSVSRLESGKMAITPQAIDMGKMIRDTIDQLRFLAHDKGLELNYDAPGYALPMVKADPDRVMQVLVNLISNAIKYTPKGSVSIKVIKGKDNLRVQIIDTGLGMSKEQRLHLFEKFYRVSSSDTTGIVGTGLGLYITKSLMERMNGDIDLESTLGKGSTFTITFPLFEAEQTVFS